MRASSINARRRLEPRIQESQVLRGKSYFDYLVDAYGYAGAVQQVKEHKNIFMFNETRQKANKRVGRRKWTFNNNTIEK